MPYYPEKRPDLAERDHQLKAAQQRKKLLRLFIVVPACAMLIWGIAGLIRYGSDLSASRQTAAELREIYEQPTDVPVPKVTKAPAPAVMEAPAAAVPAPAESPAPEEAALLPDIPYPQNPGKVISERFSSLQKKSRYIVGWLRMDSADEPVVLKDNTYFLDHDAEGKKNANGAIFMDSGTRLETRPYTVILYGHNMKSGNMFGRLHKYKDSDYLRKNRIITFDTLYEDGRFAVFAAAEINTVPGTSAYFDIWSLDTPVREERAEALRKLEIRSFSGISLDIQPDDQILLLVTCVGDDDYRLVVAARRLRDGETESSLTYRKY